jgi:Tol biopolymer transport system component
MAFLKRVSEQTVFVADINEGGKLLSGVRRLVLSGTLNRVGGWTPDGSAVLFESQGASWNISRQRLDSTTSESLVTSHEQVRFGRFTPDGKWLFYVLRKRNGDASLMQMQPTGGLPQIVWSNANLERYYCTTAPVNFCVAAVRERTQMVFYRIDPGEDPPPGGFRDAQLREVARSDYGPTSWGISPDGSRLAMIKPELNEGRIHIVPLLRNAGAAAPPPYDVIVKGWTDLVTVSWAHGGKGWYVSNQMERITGPLLYVDPAGNATVLKAPESFVPIWAVPSPDGRHLAFTSYPGIQNAWMIESF